MYDTIVSDKATTVGGKLTPLADTGVRHVADNRTRQPWLEHYEACLDKSNVPNVPYPCMHRDSPMLIGGLLPCKIPFVVCYQDVVFAYDLLCGEYILLDYKVLRNPTTAEYYEHFADMYMDQGVRVIEYPNGVVRVEINGEVKV